jgi:deoxycytidylate deaminase
MDKSSALRVATPQPDDLKFDDEVEKMSSIERVQSTHTQELIVALCGYIGTDIHSVSDTIKTILTDEYGYECDIIRMSEFIEKNSDKMDVAPELEGKTTSEEYLRIKNLIHNGDRLRKLHGNSILAELAIAKIGAERTSELGDKSITDMHFQSRRKCFIIDSIKNPYELYVLKEVYRNLLYFIGIFSPDEMRKEFLKKKEMKEIEIVELIEQDTHEDFPHGQGVGDTFMQADYFLRVDSLSIGQTRQKLHRVFHLVFGTEIITPTDDETAMYFAASAATNSACLSRQVGAAITDQNGNLISVGWNDVPCFGGNLYQHKSQDSLGENDNRCTNFFNGKCSNDFHKDRISKKLIELLVMNGLVDKEKKSEAIATIRSSELKGLIEYSRAIHAEMHAIIIGSQKAGDKMIKGKLFCTTYPCHNCARHIVLAGIIEVYYIQPYPKSLATELHSDSITTDEAQSNKVKFLLYDGIAPSRYQQLFKMLPDSRKDRNGKKIKVDYKKVKPRYSETLQALYTLESFAARHVKKLDIVV